MQYIKFSVNFVKKLMPGEPCCYADSEIKALQIRVSKNAVSYYFRKKHNGKDYECKIGEHPDITLEEAKITALNKLSALANYSQINTPIVRLQPTVREVLDFWISCQKNKNAAKNMVVYWRNIENKKIAELTADDVESVFKSVSTHAPVAANHAVIYLKAAINKTCKKLKVTNPVPNIFDGIEKNKQNHRRRTLSPQEAPAFINCLKRYSENPRYQDQALAILLMIYSGQRKTRCLQVTAEQIDVENKIWSVPGNEKKLPVELSLNEFAWEILQKQIKKYRKGFLFRWKNKPMSECRKTFSAVCRECEIEDLHLHDLRRSLGTWMLSSGASIEVVSKTLGHSSIRVTEQVYAHLLPDKGREATTAAIAAMQNGKI
jgi:integrase